MQRDLQPFVIPPELDPYELIDQIEEVGCCNDPDQLRRMLFHALCALQEALTDNLDAVDQVDLDEASRWVALYLHRMMREQARHIDRHAEYQLLAALPG